MQSRLRETHRVERAFRVAAGVLGAQVVFVGLLLSNTTKLDLPMTIALCAAAASCACSGVTIGGLIARRAYVTEWPAIAGVLLSALWFGALLWHFTWIAGTIFGAVLMAAMLWDSNLSSKAHKRGLHQR